MRTPWGESQQVSEPAPGITVVSTASHGGIKLSRSRLAQVHPALRAIAGSYIADHWGRSWFEEDCEAYIVAYTFPEAFGMVEIEAIKRMLRQVYPAASKAAGV